MAYYSRPIPIQFGHSSSSAKSSGPPPLGLAGPGEEGVQPTLHARPGGASVKVFNPGQHGADLRVLAFVSLIALVVMAAVSMGLGWLMAGRVLRPLSTITNAARDISATDLHRRLALDGPNDEFKELGDTFDGLLAKTRRVLQRSAPVRRQRLPRAAHPARPTQDPGAGHAGGPQRHARGAARRPRTRARLRGSAGAADRGAPQSRRQRAGPRPARAGRPRRR